MGLAIGSLLHSHSSFVMYLLLGQNLSRKRLFQWDDLKKTGFEKVFKHN